MVVMHAQDVQRGCRNKRKRADRKKLRGGGKDREIDAGAVKKKVRFSAVLEQGKSVLVPSPLHGILKKPDSGERKKKETVKNGKWRMVGLKENGARSTSGCHVRACAGFGYESEELVEIEDAQGANIENGGLCEDLVSQGDLSAIGNKKRRKRKKRTVKVGEHDEVNGKGGKNTTMTATEHPQAGRAQKPLNTKDLMPAWSGKQKQADQREILPVAQEPSTISTKEEATSGSGISEKSQNLAPNAEGFANSKVANPSRISKLMMKFHGRFMSGHFRYLNEKLYNGTGDENFSLMHKDKTLFDEYHRGYSQQMKSWPKLPVEVAISWLKKKPRSWKVADFGCGDARLEKGVPQDVSSLDLVAMKPEIIECNMAHTPLDSQSHDCAVFCLALMGTDYPDYLAEAHRILKHGGMLWIAEVCSRFVREGGREEYDAFNSALEALGFKKIQRSWPNKFFVVAIYEKTDKEPAKTVKWPNLKACAYKKR